MSPRAAAIGQTEAHRPAVGTRALLAMVADCFEAPGGDRRILAMEGLRGVAVLLVFFVHYHGIFGRHLSTSSLSHQTSAVLASLGHSGVDLFFMISGYLIYGTVQRGVPYPRFLRRRVERIFPTFLVVLAAYVALSLLFPARTKLPAEPWPAVVYVVQNALLLPGVFPIRPMVTVAWTLSYEFFYYLTIPILVAVTGMRAWPRPRRVAFFAAVSALYLALGLFGSAPRLRMVMFASGILVWEALDDPRVRSRLTRHWEWCACAILLPLLALVHLVAPQAESMPALADIGATGSRAALLFVAFFMVGVFAFRAGGPMSRLLSWTPVRWLGNMSYSYYLVHGLALHALASIVLLPDHRASALAFWAGMAFAFLVTVATSALLYLIVERPVSLRPATR
jgi:peptidoglycan/LPS O-acetylase OafA/YrhL